MIDPTVLAANLNDVRALIALEDEEALEHALTSVTPAIAAQVVSAAPTLQQKTTMLWALDDRRRREVLELLPPALIGALVQNVEDDNRYLLGDLSLRQFRALLSLCSPERKFYWITTALSFTDARANALPLLLTTPELVEILLTRGDFETQLRAIADFPLENQRLPANLMDEPLQTLVDLFGPENMLTQFPVQDPGLAQVLQTILDYDPDRYVDLVREGMRGLDYAANHPDEWETVAETPVLLESVEPVEVLPDSVNVPEEHPEDRSGPALALVPVGGTPLMRTARSLPTALQSRVAEDLQQLFIRQSIAEGGSFLLSDLRKVAKSVEAYLLLGLEAESGYRPERAPAVLAARPLHRISQSGARVVERLRQIALRLQPLNALLGTSQRALVRSLIHPRLTTTDAGRPELYLLPGENLPDSAELPAVGRLLQEVVAWTEITRAVGREQVEARLAAQSSVNNLMDELALAAVLYARVELDLVTPDDLARFARRYVTPEEPDPDVKAREGLERVVTHWAAEHQIDPSLVTSLFAAALERIAARGAVA